jgi:hypothetical protein
MPFPQTTQELLAAGYKFDNDANCRGCGASIEWWITPKHKRMPMDVHADDTVEPHWSTCPEAKEFKK